MPNRLTAVPRQPVPMLGRAMGPVIVVADAFMWLMLSRPGGLSLRTAWVTPATMLLAVLFAPAAALLAALLLRHGGLLSAVLAVLLLVTCVGSAAVALVGAVQRLRLRS